MPKEKRFPLSSAIKTIALIITFVTLTPLRAHAAETPPNFTLDQINEWRARDMKFRAHYHRWAAAICDEWPAINLSHTIAVRDFYTSRPEYREIVALGNQTLPFIAYEMNSSCSYYGRYLGQAVLAITGWKESEFGTFASLPELNVMLTKRLISEKLIPAEAEPPSDKTK